MTPGDDVTDWLQARLDAVPWGAALVELPLGSYYIRTVTMRRGRVTVRAAGKWLTTLHTVAGAPAFLLGDGGRSYQQGFSLEDFGLVGAGVVVDATCSTRLDKLNIVDANGPAVTLKNSSGAPLVNEMYCSVTNCDLTRAVTRHTHAGIVSSRGVYGVRVSNTAFAGCSHGIYGQDGDTWQIHHNQFDECGVPVRLDRISDSSVVDACCQQSNEEAIQLVGCEFVTVTANPIVNPCMVKHEAGFGIGLWDSSHCVVTGNTIRVRADVAGGGYVAGPSGPYRISDGVRESGASDYNEIGPNVVVGALFDVRWVGQHTRVLSSRVRTS